MATAEPGPGPAGDPFKPACAVTFGRSTPLGRHLAAALADSGRWSAIAVLDSSPFPPRQPTPPDSNPDSPLLHHHVVDLSDPAALASALSGAAAVFHVDPTTSAAALAASGSGGGSFVSLHRLAVEGTRRLLAACRAGHVGRLVYTGSTDVVAVGPRDLINADEDSTPYPDKFGNPVTELRAQVEMMVLGADGMGGMRTCVLRPSNMFGPGEPLVRFFVEYARSPLGKFVVGNGSNMSDFTYVENVAHANICAEQALCSNSASVAGKLFFVTNDHPIETWEFMDYVLEVMDRERPRFNLPAKMLLFVALFSNMIHHRLGFQMFSTPLLHPDTIYFLTCSRTFNTSKAKTLLGYHPIAALKSGFLRTSMSILELSRSLESSKQRGSCGPSKADKLLGSGTAADILLWRDEKRTFSYVTALFVLFYWFLLSDRTFIASAAKILLVSSLALFIHGVLPPQVFGFTVEKVTSDYFEVSHSTLRDSLMCLSSAWNGGIHKLRILAEGDDWGTLLKALAFLFSIKLMLHFQFRVLVGLVLASMFIIFIVYEQCEEEIDSFVTVASVKIKWLMDKVVANLPASLKAYIS